LKEGSLSFNAVLVQAVQEGLDSMGPCISDAVLIHLQKVDAVRFHQQSIDAEAFDDGLKKIFGYGAKLIEKRILELLYRKLETPRKIRDDFTFSEEVKKAQELRSSTAMMVANTHLE
jgi:hypothetical protein